MMSATHMLPTLVYLVAICLQHVSASTEAPGIASWHAGASMGTLGRRLLNSARKDLHAALPQPAWSRQLRQSGCLVDNCLACHGSGFNCFRCKPGFTLENGVGASLCLPTAQPAPACDKGNCSPTTAPTETPAEVPTRLPTKMPSEAPMPKTPAPSVPKYVITDFSQCGGYGGSCAGSSAKKCKDAAWPEDQGGRCISGLSCYRVTQFHWQCDTKQPVTGPPVAQFLPSDFRQCGGTLGKCKGSKAAECKDKAWPAGQGGSCKAGLACIRVNGYYWGCDFKQSK